MRNRHFAAIFLCLIPTAPMAQDFLGDDARFSLGAGVSTLGLTVEPSIRFGDRWGIRAPIGAGKLNLEDESNGYEYSGDLDMGGIGLMGDYYPFASGFRISAGAFYTDYSADISSDDVVFAGFVNSEVRARIRQKRDFAPAIAVGYDGKFSDRGTLSFTVGGIFGDGFDVSASESSGLVPQDLVDAEVDDIRDDLNDYDVIPYLQLSVSFAF